MHSSDGPVQALPAHDMRGVGPARHRVGSTFLETSSQSKLICLPPNNTDASSQPPEPSINELTEGSGGGTSQRPSQASMYGSMDCRLVSRDGRDSLLACSLAGKHHRVKLFLRDA